MAVSVISKSSVREETLRSLDRLPRLSPMVAQLLTQLSKPSCEITELVETVERDPVLSGQILRLSNSAIFGRLRPVASVRHAVAMLGLGAMRKFVLASSISNLFSRAKFVDSFSIRRFNLHSVTAATLVELLSEEVPFEAGGDAFLAGLLHDIGKLLIAVSLPRQYEQILALVAVAGGKLIDAERDVLGIDHAELSGLAVSRWELSEAIQWAACYHHCPSDAVTVEGIRPQKASLSLGVHCADAYINYLGMSVMPVSQASQASPASPTAHTLEIPGFPFPEERVRYRLGEEILKLGDMFR